MPVKDLGVRIFALPKVLLLRALDSRDLAERARRLELPKPPNVVKHHHIVEALPCSLFGPLLRVFLEWCSSTLSRDKLPYSASSPIRKNFFMVSSET